MSRYTARASRSYCASCSATELQTCSQMAMTPDVVVLDHSEGKAALVECTKCGKRWKTRARYLRLCLKKTDA